MSNTILNEKWLKASIIGTFWAASEIVLGSFLHNLKIPFSGNILTAIGVILLISISYNWKEKGLFWRAGLICAIMKTLSPSAVIFGPMIAIFSQSILLETFTRVFGRTIAGYILGAIFAMSWNLFQKIINYIIFYGYNIIEIYKNLIQYAQNQINLYFETLWLPILILLAIYGLFGLVAAILGIKAGRTIKANKDLKGDQHFRQTNRKFETKNHDFNYSIYLLFINLILIASALLLINYTAWPVWSLSIITIVSIWLIRYKRALRKLTQSKFWIYFFLITMIAAFVFTKIQSNSLQSGLLIGLQMNFRAIIIIIGFSVLGTELYNPKIRNYFLKSSFKQLPMAIELAFSSLPETISSLPDVKIILKKPVTILNQMVTQAECKLAEIKKQMNFTQKVFIITGSIGQGKTTFIQTIIENFQSKGISLCGIYSPRVMQGKKTVGYDIIDINTKKREVFLRQNYAENNFKIGRFNINLHGLQKGIKAIKKSSHTNIQIVIIDEVGVLELENNGWAKNIEELIRNSQNHILLTIRDSFVEKVIEKWEIKNYQIFDIKEKNCSNISDIIYQTIVQSN
ncbi:MAG TPA: nucleoside-triphosphatase [Bacteroidales bacterium]|nr:nucleoside-triphosphatase [Bacteroidales bacterium]